MRSVIAFVSAVKARKGGKALSKALSLSVLNQVVSSGTSFALGIYLVRVLPPAEFGLYGIGFAICLFYSGIGNALLLTQMVVHTADRPQEDRSPYAARMLMATTLFCLLTLVVVGLVICFTAFWLGAAVPSSSFVLAVTGASIAYLLRDFFVRHAYTARMEGWALVVNVSVAISLLAFLLLKHQADGALTSVEALWLYALGNLAGAGVGAVLVRLPLASTQLSRVVEDMREAWIGGRWAMGGVSVAWAQSQAYLYVTALFAGAAGVAQASAARLLISPVIFLVPAFNQVIMPRLVELRATALPRMLQAGGLFTIALLVFAVLYSVTLLGLIDVIVPTLLGSQYKDVEPLVAAWCLVMFFQLARGGASTILQVMKEFRFLTLANVVSALMAVGAAVLLMTSIGVHGAILGTAIGELILAGLLVRLVWGGRHSVR